MTSSFFDVLGVRAALGRTFRPGDDRNAALPPVVIGHTLWRDRFGQRADILGQRVALNGQAVEIVGVLPR